MNAMSIRCGVTGRELSAADAIPATSLRPNIFDLIRHDYPNFTKDSYISQDSLNAYRGKYLTNIIQAETGSVNTLEEEVVKSITSHGIIAGNVEDDLESDLSLGQRMADRIAAFGGSWTFIITFFSFILIWMLINIIAFSNQGFDPYPFILLNLILSCLAAIQAPIIMMSQNRQEEKDRLRSEHDYMINLKAELEIKLLHEKMDHIIQEQNTRLLEIQQIQADYLEDILSKIQPTK